MDKELKEFLERKKVELCYAGKQAFPVNTMIPYEWLKEYGQIQYVKGVNRGHSVAKREEDNDYCEADSGDL